MGHTGPSNSMPSETAAADLRQALVAVRRNLEKGDVAALRRAVLDWASLHHDRHFGSLSALARVSSDELARQLQSLDRSLYGVDEVAGSYQGLIETLRNEPSLENQRQRIVNACALPHLSFYMTARSRAYRR